MEIPWPRDSRAESEFSWSELCQTDEERAQYGREGKVMFSALNEPNDEDEIPQIKKDAGMDTLPSPYFSHSRYFTPDYAICRSARKPPPSPPLPPPQPRQQHNRVAPRPRANRGQKPPRSDPPHDSRKKSKGVEAHRPVTRATVQGLLQEVEVDSRRGKVRYWHMKHGPSEGWTFHLMEFADYYREYSVSTELP
ncbi:MAG: hypothetical protein OHK93_003337 [Ramalina farinacea]|uniref:Uncharacterized protein n=1 Tax=Ramalina farinacea TaxID=258253 RepID=A0AA43QXJ9_9LECA|nr:hypothetical protein [Ramalina farinacea]